MSLVIAEHVTQAYGTLEVLKDVSFRLAESDRVGLVGPNGEGKTTMLRILAGQLEPTSGQVHRAKSLRCGYLPQDPPALEGSTIHDAMLEIFADLRAKERQIEEMTAQMAGNDDPALLERFGQLQTEFEDAGGYDYHNRIEQVLTGLSFPRDMWDRPLAQLSGGQRTRAYLATLLLRQPDLLMLDEPTNHLDLDAVEWLEGYLANYRGVLVVVSHDRYFLDNVTTGTWEIAAGTLETYRGSYTQFLPKREERLAERQRTWESQQEYIRKTQDFIAQHIAGQRTKEAQGRRTRLERFIKEEAIPQPRVIKQMHLSLNIDRRMGDIAMRASDLAVGYEAGKPLFTVDSLEMIRGQRIAIVGANGIGKTTLLRTVLGDLEALGGEVQFGSNVKLGYLSQTHAELDPQHTAIEAVTSTGLCNTPDAQSALGALQLSGEAGMKKITELSGGQRSRVILARLAVQNANLLMLDEPTNHLDIDSTEILQRALRDFEGTVLFVSHDRYLIQNVATHIWAIDGNSVKCLLGGWDDFVKWRSELPARNAGQPQSEDKQQAKEQRKADYKQARKQANLMQRLQRRHTELEELIDQTEARLEELNAEISAAGEAGDMKKIETLGNEYNQAQTHLNELWAEWEQVGEELE